jgi:hypothetical protein
MKNFEFDFRDYEMKFVKGKEVFVRTSKIKPSKTFTKEEIRIIILMSTFIVNWDPHTDTGRVALLKHLDDKLHTTEYTDLFPELTVDVLAYLHKIYLMANFIVNACDNATSGVHSAVGYKRHLFDGPDGTSMVLVPTPAVYGTAADVVDADIMAWVGNLRDTLMTNNAWTDDIAKDLWLFGTEGTFDKDTYKAHYSVNPFPTYLHFHVSTKHVKTHNIYIRVKGATVWEAPIRFDGANFDVHRDGTTPQNLEVMFKGIINNVETPMVSVITPVLYTPTV